VSIAYVSVAGEKRIAVLHLDDARGTVSVIDSVPVPGPGSKAPISMPLALSPDRRFLYAAVRSPPYPVSTFAVDAASGRFTLTSTSVLPEAMAHISTDRSGRFLFGASYSGSMLSVSAIGADGRIGAGPVQTMPARLKSHSLLTAVGNRFAYAAVLGEGAILRMSFEPATGRLLEPTPWVRAPVKGSPRHLVFHPTGRWLYCINELDATVDCLAVDAETGALSLQHSLPIALAPAATPPSAADIHITPDGRFLYASERTQSVIACFAIDSANGSLFAAGVTPTELSPRGFNIDPRGCFLLSAGQGSGRIAVYAIDPGTGNLAHVDTLPVGPNPNWIEFFTPAGE
jgi:6-phosphogluconolactonase